MSAFDHGSGTACEQHPHRRHLAEKTQDQGEQNGKDNRRHDRKIDTDISVWTFVFDVTWKKRKSGRDVRSIGCRASVGEPTNESKSKHHDDEYLKNRNHDAARL